jgi:hypothetical protein
MALNYTVSGSLQPLEQQAFGILECRNSDKKAHLGEVTLDTMGAATSALDGVVARFGRSSVARASSVL